MKNDFLSTLNTLLRKIPETEREEMLYDFKEHFEVGIENGKSEQEIIRELGDPKQIAKDLLTDYRITKAETDRSVKNIFHLIVATVSLSFFNLIFILAPIVAIFAVYLSLCLTALIFTLSPVLVVVSIAFNGFNESLFNFFATLVLCGIGILLSVGMVYVGKYLYNKTIQYAKFNVNIIKGEKSV